MANEAAVRMMQLVVARDGVLARPASDVMGPELLPLATALQHDLEGKTQLERVQFRAPARLHNHVQRLEPLRGHSPWLDPQTRCVNPLIRADCVGSPPRYQQPWVLRLAPARPGCTRAPDIC